MLWTLLALVAVWWCWAEVGRRVRAHRVATTTALNELAEAGAPRAGPKIKGRVVVCGGSIAGLLAARVCSAHFEEVLVVEPEAWTASAEGAASVCGPDGESSTGTAKIKRARVFQYEAVHGYLVFFSLALEKLFPNYHQAMKEDGIPYCEANARFAISGVSTAPPTEFYPLTGMPRHPIGTRDALERLVRRLARENCRNVRWTTGTVTGVIPASSSETAGGEVGDMGRRLEGVVLRNAEGKEERVNAALVVDCTGASVAGTKWLDRAGYGKGTSTKSTDSAISASTVPKPKPVPNALSLKTCKLSYDPKVRYRCFTWVVPPESRARVWALGSALGRKSKSTGGNGDGSMDRDSDERWFLYIYAPTADMDRRFFGLNVGEANKIIGVCGGWDVDPSSYPRTLTELKEYIRSLRGLRPVAPWVYEVVDLLVHGAGYGEDDDELAFNDFRIPPFNFFQYHRVPDLPSNFVALGDAVLRVNPAGGHGCSKAAIGAVTLNSLLLRTGDVLPLDFGKRFFESHATKVEEVWNGTKIPDYAWDTTVPQEGETLATGAWLRAYFNLVLRASWTDREIQHLLFLDAHLLGPGGLLSPRIVVKVLWNALTGSRTPPPDSEL